MSQRHGQWDSIGSCPAPVTGVTVKAGRWGGDKIDKAQQIEAALSASFIFPALGAEERARFIAAARPQSYRAGDPIFLMGDEGNSMMLIETGHIRISYPSPEGKTVLLSELEPGAVFGEIALLDGGPRSADATAATNCTLLVFERRDFIALLEHNWALAEAVLKLVCARLRRADERMADLAFFELPGRLAKTLLSRASPSPSTGLMRVSDTQGTLATLIGGSRETVNRCLRKWEGEGLIEVSEGRITLLDTQGLARLAS
jgi:CRP/FNR family transcriptional regulator, cyclic AMP receptor protein